MAKKPSKVNTQQTSLFQREIPKMPEGCYYSGDKPNPNLRSFVEEHLKERPYNPITDNYNVVAFDKPIDDTKATAIYNMHTYWSKKPHDAIRQYIRHYTQPGDLVLDPFCGSGGTALAALMEGRKAIAIDRSPAATFIAKNYCTPVDVSELQTAFEKLKAKVKPEIDWLYETKCDRCGGKATTAYTVYSQVFQCTRCMTKVSLFDCAHVDGETADGKPKKISVCPVCYKKGNIEEISTRDHRFGAIPVLVSYICQNGCTPAQDQRRHNDSGKKKREYFEKYDLAKIREVESKPIPHWYPKDRMMNAPEEQERWGVKWRAGTSNFRTVDALFTKRNLWALAVLKAAAESLDNRIARDVILFALTGVVLGMSQMNQYRPDVTYPTSVMKGTYYVPQTFQEEPPLKHILNKIDRLGKGFDAIREEIRESRLIIDTRSSTNLSAIAANVTDYIFTDPPYADNVQYGELNFVWEAWLGFDTRWQDEEIIINEVRGKTELDWANMMREAMAECYRVLKPGRWLSLCYHDTSEGTWALVQDIMAEVGFLVDKSESVLFIDTGQKSYNQLTADKVNKRDLVINFRKPKLGEVADAVAITGDEDDSTFSEKVHAIIRDYLSVHPGSTKDRVYDEVVSRMVRAGRMEAHNFDELLGQVAEDAGGTERRWYLRETQTAVIDAAEWAKEEAAAGQVGKFIAKQLKANPEAEGIHYSDLFEHFVYTVKDKPRRSLADWLPDYFYKTDEGTWRLPLNEEEEQVKAQIRVSGTNRHVKRYLSYLQQGIAVPAKSRPNDATLAEWIRQSKRSGLYEQGKVLYERGGLNFDALPEEMQVEVEEDYQVCVRMLKREVGGETGKKRGRKAKQEKLEL